MIRSFNNRALLVSSNRPLIRFLQDKLFAGTPWRFEILSADVLDICVEIRAADADLVMFYIDEDPGYTLTSVLRLMVRSPRPVLIVTSDSDKLKNLILKCLEMGAVDVLSLPSGLNALGGNHRERMLEVVDAARRVRVRPVPPSRALAVFDDKQLEHTHDLKKSRERFVSEFAQRCPFEAVGVAISTGGPQALSHFLPALPETLPAPVFVVQHIIRGFIDNIARRLDGLCAMQVKIAEHGEKAQPGVIYLAPDAYHLKVARDGGGLRIELDEQPEKVLHRPSADVLFSSLAQSCGGNCVAAIMTGMGRDGVQGLAELKKHGAAIIAQDQDSSAIYGMARVAAEQGLVDHVVPLQGIADRILKLMLGDDSAYSSNETVSS